MKRIQDVDKDMRHETSIKEDNIRFFNVKDDPFDLYGFYSANKGENFLRMPLDTAEKVAPDIPMLATLTAGGRVRFKTNSPYVAISVKYSAMVRLPHMSYLGTMGFDMYVFKNGEYKYANVRDFIPPWNVDTDGFESIHYFSDSEMRDITINFPLYNDVLELYIGLEDGCILEHGGKYVNDKPIIYYGSSITQGGCASRPGNSYQGMISRKYNCDFINLGFSGSAYGQEAMGEYIANLDMACFVSDYDQNATDADHLRRTHSKFINIIREKNPDLPIILMTSVLRTQWTQDIYEERKKVIYKTYADMISNGDKNVYYIDGQHIFGDEGTTDGAHPNDIGFMYMAKTISEVLEKVMNF